MKIDSGRVSHITNSTWAVEIRTAECFFLSTSSQRTIAEALFVTHSFESLIATTKAQIKSAASYRDAGVRSFVPSKRICKAIEAYCTYRRIFQVIRSAYCLFQKIIKCFSVGISSQMEFISSLGYSENRWHSAGHSDSS